MAKKKPAKTAKSKTARTQAADRKGASAEVSKPPEPDRPGRLLTWWHPLFASFLEWLLSGAYEVHPEKPLSQEPLRADVFLIQRKGGELSAQAEQDMPLLTRLLNYITFIEFKGPTDDLRQGDFHYLIALAMLFYSRADEAIPWTDVTLVFVAPAVTAAFRRDATMMGYGLEQIQPGMHEVRGGVRNPPFSMCVLETIVLARQENLPEPILTLLSPLFLDDPQYMAAHFKECDRDSILYYAMQRIEQFAMRNDFRQRYEGIETMTDVKEELKAAWLNLLPVEERLKNIPVEERLKDVPLDVLRDYLQRHTGEEGSTAKSKKKPKKAQKKSTK